MRATLRTQAHGIGYIVATMLLAVAVSILACPTRSAFAVTAAEKQLEADEVFAQIDRLQTSLNEAYEEYETAVEARDEAIAARDEAQATIERETARIEKLQDRLSKFAVGMYKQGGDTRYLEVLLGTTSFEDFLTSWDAVTNISNDAVVMLEGMKEARATAEAARQTFQEQSERAEEEMAAAEAKQEQIERTQDELREQAAKITAEVAELQAKEEYEAEQARLAEEARRAREEAIASGTAGASVLMGSGYFTNPCPAAFNSSGFGYRTFDNSFHMGLDMAAAEGTPYYAADSGTVIYATYDGGWNGGAGNWIVISHGNGIVTKYMHSLQVFVRVGERVERGQNIGLVGETGQAFGAHLHFQVEVDGVAVNPLNYI